MILLHLFLAVPFLAATAIAGEPEKDPVLASSQEVVDVAVLSDGTACLLRTQKGPMIVKPGDWQAQPLAPLPRKDLKFLRVFAGTDGKTLLRVVAMAQESLPMVYAWRGGAWEKEGELPKPLPRPQEVYKLRFFQDKGGAVWICDGVETAFRVAGGKVDSHDISAGGGNPNAGGHNWMVAGIAESKDDTIAIHHQVGQFGACTPGKFVTTFRAGKWEDIEHGMDLPGAACFDAKGSFVLTSNNTIFQMQLGAGVTTTNAAPESLDKLHQTPVFLRATADGALVSIWGGGNWVYYIAPPYANGFVTRIMECKDGQWTDPDVGADRSFWNFHFLERPSCQDPAGGLWIGTSGGGVLHRARDGKWTRLNWRRGVRAQVPTRLAADDKGILWVVDSAGTCEAIDTKAALAMDALAPSSWDEEWLCTPLKERSDGIWYGTSAEKGGALVVLDRDGRKTFPMDPEHVRLESANVVSKDAADGFWVFEGLGNQLSEHFDGKKWERFPKEKWNELQARLGQDARRFAGATLPGSSPEGCPIPSGERLWTSRKDGWTWVGGRDLIACSQGAGWATLPTKGSPLDGRTPVTSVFRDPQGKWWFWITGLYGHYAVYQPRKVKFESAAPDLGKVAGPGAIMKFKLDCELPLESLVLQARVDDGPWRPYAPDTGFAVGMLTRGKHKIIVEGLGKKEMVAVGPLMFDLESTFDAEAVVAALIQKLGDESFRVREQAVKDLLSTGKIAIKQLEQAKKSRDPEVSTRAREILKKLADSEPGETIKKN